MPQRQLLQIASHVRFHRLQTSTGSTSAAPFFGYRWGAKNSGIWLRYGYVFASWMTRCAYLASEIWRCCASLCWSTAKWSWLPVVGWLQTQISLAEGSKTQLNDLEWKHQSGYVLLLSKMMRVSTCQHAWRELWALTPKSPHCTHNPHRQDEFLRLLPYLTAHTKGDTQMMQGGHRPKKNAEQPQERQIPA